MSNKAIIRIKLDIPFVFTNARPMLCDGADWIVESLSVGPHEQLLAEISLQIFSYMDFEIPVNTLQEMVIRVRNDGGKPKRLVLGLSIRENGYPASRVFPVVTDEIPGVS